MRAVALRSSTASPPSHLRVTEERAQPARRSYQLPFDNSAWTQSRARSPLPVRERVASAEAIARASRVRGLLRLNPEAPSPASLRSAPSPARGEGGPAAPYVVSPDLKMLLRSSYRSSNGLLDRSCASRPTSVPPLPLQDRRMAPQRAVRALDHRHIDHLAVDSDRAAPGSGRLFVGRDDAARRRDLFGARRKLRIEDRHLARMDDGGAEKSEAAGPPHGLLERVEVLVLRDRAD